MAEYMTIPENSLTEELSMSNVDTLRAIDNGGKSIEIKKVNVSFPASQITNDSVVVGNTTKDALNTLNADLESIDESKVNITTQVIAGNGLSGVGDLSTNRTLNISSADDGITVNADSIQLAPVTNLTSTSTTKALAANQGKALKDAADIAIADENAIAPQIAFNKRVLADGGTVRSKAFMQRVFEANKDLLSDTELLYVPECGMKVTDGKIEKLYNLVGTNDAVQGAENSRFYAGNLIAPSEKIKIKCTDGQGLASINFSDVSFGSSDSWTALLKLNLNKIGDITSISFGSASLNIYSSVIFLDSGNGVALQGDTTLPIGKDVSIELRYNNGTGVILVDGVSVNTTVNIKAVSFSGMISNISYSFSGTISYFQVLSKSISASESKSLHAFLSTEFPAIETIAVGSQQVATSNLEATVFGGTTVPEVQDNAAWAALTTPAWCNYNNDPALGAIYGKLYNGYAVPVINTYAPKGFHVPSELEWTMLSEYLGGNTVSGGKLKALYGGFDNEYATNEAGVSLLAGGIRLNDGGYFYLNSYSMHYISGNGFNVSSEAAALSIPYTPGDKCGMSIRLFSDTPHLEKLIYDSGYVTTDIGTGNLDIRIPFGTKATSVRVESETGITGLSASLIDYNKANPVTLLTGKTITANAPLAMNVTADQPSGYTDNYIRINGTKADVGARFIVYVKIELI